MEWKKRGVYIDAVTKNDKFVLVDVIEEKILMVIWFC